MRQPGKGFALGRAVDSEAIDPGELEPLLPDIDAFLERMRELTGEHRRRITARQPKGTSDKRNASDRRFANEPKIDLVLYTSSASEQSTRALRAIQRVLRGYDSAQVRFSTCDLSKQPLDGEVHSVVFTPTLVKQGPGPRTSIVGNLENTDALRDLLDASGVDRRWVD